MLNRRSSIRRTTGLNEEVAADAFLRLGVWAVHGALSAAHADGASAARQLLPAEIAPLAAEFV